MTMVSAIKQTGRALMFADSAIVDASTGCVVDFAPKLHIGQHFPWSAGITVVGPTKILTDLGELNARDVDGLIEQIAALIQSFHERAASSGFRDAAIRIVLAAWDARWNIPRIFVAGDNTGQKPSYWCPPGTTEVEYFFGTDEPAASEIAKLWEGGSPNDPEVFSHGDSIEAFEICRRNSYTPIGGNMPAGCYVGGEIHLAIVSSDGVSAAPIHEWPDRVGRPIEVATVQ